LALAEPDNDRTFSALPHQVIISGIYLYNATVGVSTLSACPSHRGGGGLENRPGLHSGRNRPFEIGAIFGVGLALPEACLTDQVACLADTCCNCATVQPLPDLRLRVVARLHGCRRGVWLAGGGRPPGG